jgi:hypothetical protein
VTDNVQGIGSITYHEFSGIKRNPGGAGVSEPYLITVPGLETCPGHVEF